MRLYHYTSVLHLGKILQDGFLKVTESNIAVDQEHAGPDVVWLTDERNLLGVGPKAGWTQGTPVDKTGVRIAVEVDDAERWRSFARRHHADPAWLAILNRSGGGAASHWYVVEHPIERAQWAEISVRLEDGQVLGIDPHTDIEQWGSDVSVPVYLQQP